MRKKIIPISLFLISILVGFLLFGHFNSLQFASSDDELGKLQDQEKAIDLLITEQSDLKENILTLREEIDTLSANKSYYADQQKLEELNTQLGLTEMTGPGITLTIQTTLPELTPDDITIYAADLRDIIQRLWSGDAQAISINDQRITALTAITPVGRSILVNDTRIFPPFEITALEGDSILLQEMNFSLYLPEIQSRIDSGEYILTTSTSDSLTMPVFTGRMPADHLTLHTND